MTLTPSERHSGLAIRLYRGRSCDPAFGLRAQDMRPWIGPQRPSLVPGSAQDAEGEADGFEDVSGETVSQ